MYHYIREAIRAYCPNTAYIYFVLCIRTCSVLFQDGRVTLPLARQYKVRKSPSPPTLLSPETPSPPPPLGFSEDQLPSAPSLEIIELSPVPSTASSNHIGSTTLLSNQQKNAELIQSQAQKIFETALIHSDSYCPTIRADPMCSKQQQMQQLQQQQTEIQGKKKTKRSGSSASSGTVLEFLPPHLQTMETIEIDLTTPVPKHSIVVSQSVMATSGQDHNGSTPNHFAHNQVIQPAIRSIIKTKKVSILFQNIFVCKNVLNPF